VASSLPHSLCSLTSHPHCSTPSVLFYPEDRSSMFSKMVTQHHILEVQLPYVQPLLHGAYTAFVVLFRYQDKQLLSPYATWRECFYNRHGECSLHGMHWGIIRGVLRLEDITAAGNFLGLSDQKSSYKHVSKFGRLRSYGHFLIHVHALVWTASYGTSWQVMYSTWWLIFCVASIIFAILAFS